MKTPFLHQDQTFPVEFGDHDEVELPIHRRPDSLHRFSVRDFAVESEFVSLKVARPKMPRSAWVVNLLRAGDKFIRRFSRAAQKVYEGVTPAGQTLTLVRFLLHFLFGQKTPVEKFKSGNKMRKRISHRG